jgi:CheY-like chemotaxis protein
MYRLGLSRAGFDITVAPDWQSARAHLEARPFDLVLLDIMLPGASGIEALAELRDDPRWAHLPVAILSNSEMSPTVHGRARQLGILAWMTKSGTTPAQVARSIRRWIRDDKLTNGTLPA